jgi:hypothetical protein
MDYSFNLWGKTSAEGSAKKCRSPKNVKNKCVLGMGEGVGNCVNWWGTGARTIGTNRIENCQLEMENIFCHYLKQHLVTL